MRVLFIGISFVFIFCFGVYPEKGQTASLDTPTISAKQYILMEETTGRVLLEENADEQASIASITKVMTAVVALEYGNLSDQVKISKETIQTNGSSIYLEAGEKLTLEDLLYGLMLRSGNDAAKAIAEHIGGSEEGFTYLMNQTAAYLGMTDSHFMNPHGLDDPNHYSSAHDMALLMRYAMEHNDFREISQTKSYHAESRTYPWVNKNKLLTQKYPYSTGGKTGFTSKAGRTLISTATKNNLDLIVVTLNAPDDWRDHMQLFDYGFSAFELVRLAKKGTHSFTANEQTVEGDVLYDVIMPLKQQEQDDIYNRVQIYEETDDEQVGKMTFTLGKEPLLKVPLFKTSTKKDTKSVNWIQQILSYLNGQKDND